MAKRNTGSAVRPRKSGVVARWLIFFFPVGIVMMWDRRCLWSRSAKCAVTVAFAALLTILILPHANQSPKLRGGVELVSLVSTVEKYGPDTPEVIYESYTSGGNVIVKETIAPESSTETAAPTIVYANGNGKYYHNQTCRYVKTTTPSMTIRKALSEGYMPCTECGAPPITTRY